MCCLFGLIDYQEKLSVTQKNRMLSVLATACEKRGTDATGIAYNSGGKMRIYKRPVPARWLHIDLPSDAQVIMGHTRMTTQGNELFNYNNHPFSGKAGTQPFALAHNGVLYNDDTLRKMLSLPKTRIETDSYIAVQLIESQKTLDFSALQYMAEQIRGSFTFTVLGSDNSLYIVKGDNPMSLYHFPQMGVYLYASTEEILRTAFKNMGISTKRGTQIPMGRGEILRITSDGSVERNRFQDTALQYSDHLFSTVPYRSFSLDDESLYLDEIKAVAPSFGFMPEMIDRLSALGFSAEEIEDHLYGTGIF